jgi:uncharacterized membrane protein YfcA
MENALLWASYMLLGLFAGGLAGLLGVGGGLIIVPVFSMLFALQDMMPAHVMQFAIGSSLATIAFTSLSSMLAHQRRGAVDWHIMVYLTAGIIPGAWSGGALAVWFGGPLLVILFGLFELLVAAQMLLGRAASPRLGNPGAGRNIIAGLVIGTVSAVLGIGGGTLTVPWLVWHNVDVRRAVATSAACGLPIALAGALGFLVAGLQESELPAGSTGYLYWPAVVMVSVASVLSAPFGARLAHRIDRRRLTSLFGIFIGMLGFVMLAKGLVWIL